MKNSDFPYYMYYAPPDDGSAALSTITGSTSSTSAAAGKQSHTTPTKELSEAMAAFEAVHITGRKAKLKIEGDFSMGGFTVYGIRKSTLEKLPKEFRGYTTGGVASNGRNHC